MTNHEFQSIWLLGKSWNSLNVEYIERYLSDDCIYKSQWLLYPIKGKQQFLSYLSLKFRAIRNAMHLGLITVTAEIAFHSAKENKLCLILTQIYKAEVIRVSIFIHIESKKTNRIVLCFIPDPGEIELTGKFPK